MIKKYIKILSEFFDKEVIDMIIKSYKESHRFYHNIDHVLDILHQIDEYFMKEENKHLYMSEIYKEFIIAAFFHDIVYDVRSTTNEMDSIRMFNEYSERISPKDKKNIIGLIYCTAIRKCPSNKYQSLFWLFDNKILLRNIDELIKYEDKISKEYSFLGDKYKDKRIEFLKGESKYFNSLGIKNNLDDLILYINEKR